MGFWVKERAWSGETGVNSANVEAALSVSSWISSSTCPEDAPDTGPASVPGAAVLALVEGKDVEISGLGIDAAIGGGKGVEGLVAVLVETETAFGREPIWNEAMDILARAGCWRWILEEDIPPRRVRERSMADVTV